MGDDVQVVPTGRFEWERIVRRLTLPKPVKLLAMILASYADPDGTRVRPGNDVLADVTGDSEKNVRRLLTVLRGLDLVLLVARGGGRGGAGKASEYRLTIPSDLLDRVDMLMPGERKSPDTQMSGQSKPDCGQPVDSPVDDGDSPDTQMSAQLADVIPIDRTSGDRSDPIDRTFSAIDRTSRCPPTTHIHQPQQTKPVVTTRRNSRPRARDDPPALSAIRRTTDPTHRRPDDHPPVRSGPAISAMRLRLR